MSQPSPVRREPAPPRAAVLLIRILHPPRAREFVLGDLHEQYLARLESEGNRRAADRWYWRQAMGAAPAALRWRAARRGHGDSQALGRSEGGRGRLNRKEGMMDVARDVTSALRRLRRSPGFSLSVILTLGLGIGAATGIFSVVDGVLLRPLPFAESDRAVILCETRETHPVCTASVPNVADWQARSRTVESFGIARNRAHVLGGLEGIRSANGGMATPGLFDVLGGSAGAGRLLVDEDLEPGQQNVVVLTHGFWTRWLGSDPGAVGRDLIIDDVPHTVVGVLEPGFRVPELEHVELWTPLPYRPEDGERDWRGFLAFGRLAQGVPVGTAQDELAAVARDLEAEHPETNGGWGVRIQPLKAYVLGEAGDRLAFLLGAVGLVLLLACVNVANLQMARATARSRELAVRASLGAGRGRLVRMLLSEGLVLSAAGAALGGAVSVLGVPAILSLAPAGIPRLDEVSVDGRALAFALAVAALTTVVFALAPFLRRGASEPGGALRSRTEATGALRVRALLVAFQVATAMVLLVGAGLLARSFTGQLVHEPEFDHQKILAAWAYLDGEGQPSEAVRRFRSLADELEALPSIEEVGLGSSGPFVGWTESTTVWPADAAMPPAGSEPVASSYDVDPHYFSSQGIAVTAGRSFTPLDAEGAPSVVVVNQALARTLFAGSDPVGRRVAMGQWEGAAAEIVGVVADVTTAPGRPAPPTIYWPQLQHPRFATFFFVRAAADPAAVESAVRGRLENAGSDLVLASTYTVDERMAAVLVGPLFVTALLWIFALVAMGLAVVGVYAAVTYTVSRRVREIGVRIALGAAGRQVVARMLAGPVWMALLGIGAGLVVALALRRVIEGLLVGVGPADPLTFAVAPAVLLAVAVVAALLPARKASRLDPTEVMRAE